MRRRLDLSHSCADSLCLSSPPFSPTPSLLIHPSFYLPFSPPFFLFSFSLLSSSSLSSTFFHPSFLTVFSPFSLLPLSFPFPRSFPPSSTLLSLFLPPPFLPPSSFPLSHSSRPLALFLLSLSRTSSRGQSTPLTRMRSLGSSSSQFVGISLPVDILNMFEVCQCTRA